MLDIKPTTDLISACPFYGMARVWQEQRVINDLWLSRVSRELSLLGRKEVLSGKAKFGIFGDGKEIAQVAMAHSMRLGDFRAGYYRDQTLMIALGLTSIEDYLAQMYGDTDHDPYSGGRQMNSHFATPFVAEDGVPEDLSQRYNISSGISSTGGQMGRALGLAFATKKRIELGIDNGEHPAVTFCTIGDASTSEGVFWETVNAAAVLQVPLVIAVWDDGYGISVPTELQTAKGSISTALSGMKKDSAADRGIDIYSAVGWDYTDLCVTFDKAVQKSRRAMSPAIVHVKELTQPQGHSTSGSHERYKSVERLEWESDHDCLLHLEHWIIEKGILSKDQCAQLRDDARQYVKSRGKVAWEKYQAKHKQQLDEYSALLNNLSPHLLAIEPVAKEREAIGKIVHPSIRDIISSLRRVNHSIKAYLYDVPIPLTELQKRYIGQMEVEYSTDLYATGEQSALHVPMVRPTYSEDSPMVNGFEIINHFFDRILSKDERVIVFGEDVGKIGDVNQGMAGLQEKYGVERVFDTGIREWTIIGQGQGCAMQGLRPVAEIQYIDYLVYALPILTDDVATLRYRSAGQQVAPLIVRTRGHRLEGIWHTGSPMGMMLSSLRGMYILTPRNMVQAAGMYRTMLNSNDPAVIVECLNGYRLKERLPDNIGDYTIPLGVPEVISVGTHATVVTYGSCVRIALEAQEQLEEFGIDIEIIDVQTLIPFDIHHSISESIQRTGRVLFLDEDVPGGASAYMMQQVIEEQAAFRYLDAPPVTLTARSHRTPYGSDGDYHAKPQPEDVVEKIYQLVFEKLFV